jgi:hypothetical protein
MQEVERIYQMLNEKLFHDFAGAICVINNSVALIKSNENEINDNALELIKISSLKSVNYLKFYRFLYSVSRDNEVILFNELKYLTINFISSMNQSLILEFKASLSHAVTNNTAKIIMCLIVIITEKMETNDIINISLINDDISSKLQITTKSLNHSTTETPLFFTSKLNFNNLNMRNCHLYYTKYLMEKENFKINISVLENEILYEAIL